MVPGAAARVDYLRRHGGPMPSVEVQVKVKVKVDVEVEVGEDGR